MLNEHSEIIKDVKSCEIQKFMKPTQSCTCFMFCILQEPAIAPAKQNRYKHFNQFDFLE